ncbi:MAG: hypothetical protein ACRD0P_28835, partial [Stackebrandtia sp.]
MSTDRLTAWGDELRQVHRKLRSALTLARVSLDGGDETAAPSGDLLLFCRGFCSALTGHHRGIAPQR